MHACRAEREKAKRSALLAGHSTHVYMTGREAERGEGGRERES